MPNYKQLFMSHMDRVGVKYSDIDERVVRVTYTGDNLKSIPINVFFDKDGEGIVQLACWNIANFKDKFAAGVLACNNLNSEYRWVKYYLDSDTDVRCCLDAYIDEETCGEECLNLVRRMVNIIDDSYPTFMKALWAD